MCWCRGGRIHEKNKIKKRHNNFQGRGFCVAFLILKGPEFIIKVKNKAVYIKKTKKKKNTQTFLFHILNMSKLKRLEYKQDYLLRLLNCSSLFLFS